MQPIAIAHPHLVCYINGALFGAVTGLAFRIISAHEPRRGVDVPTPVELVPTTYSIMGAFSIIRLRDGGLEGNGFVPFGHELPRQKYLTIELIDRVTGRVLFRAVNAMVNDQNWTVQPRQLMTGQFTFEAIGFGNEASGA